MFRVLLYNWRSQRNAPANVLDETMHEDNGGFGVWNRVDASIELCVAVGYPLFSERCHVRVRSKALPSLSPSRFGHEHATCDLLFKIRIYRDCSIRITFLNN